jgi:tetratricopeptide (TPR) repeat protein
MLYLNHVAMMDWLIALEFGRVDDAQPPENWRGVTEHFGYLYDSPDGRCVGFKVLEYSAFDPEADEAHEIWNGPRFDSPLLGLRDVTAGEIIVAARSLIGDASTINREYFEAAIDEQDDPDKALPLWLACLQAGDSMAHFALGYTLYDLGRFHDAYRHLRHYTEIAPCYSWNWRWFGRAAEAMGELDEARRAYERAIALEDDGQDETDARDLLAELDSRP